MTTTPAAVEALKLAEKVKQLAISAAEYWAKSYFWKHAGIGHQQEGERYESERIKLFASIDRLAALAHQSPPTGVSGSQAKSEAVGWFESPHGQFRANPMYRHEFPSQLLKWQIPLYAAPQEAVERQPLSEQECRRLYTSIADDPCAEPSVRALAMAAIRATEHFHGIGPATQEKPE
jgi:hypothetical protein